MTEPPLPPDRSPVCAVVIGRNEGARLDACLRSLGDCDATIYVDSGSTDDSVALARSLGAHVVNLDMSVPFTAARARNEGFAEIRALGLPARYVQFVDGDCEVIAGWIDAARHFLDIEPPDVAVVCGQRVEKAPEASLYNLMCDREWDTPVGPAAACGGDAMMRVDAFVAVGGFTASQIAHEEPEMCLRMRRAGFRIFRIDRKMTSHDANILRLSQFYKRNRRAGFGLTQCFIERRTLDRSLGPDIVMRALLWAVAIPTVLLLLVIAIGPVGLLGLLLYPLQILRQARSNTQRIGGPFGRRVCAATVTMVGKFAETQGVAEYLVKRAFSMKMAPIFYKN